MTITKELLCCVTSTDTANHRIAVFKERTIYRNSNGEEWASLQGQRRTVLRTTTGLAVLHIDWKRIGSLKLSDVLNL